jgi:suppressor of G2 allele of SKP1
MDACTLFASANVHYVNEEYDEALKHYTCAVTLEEDCIDYRTCRAACYLKLGKFAEALEDVEHVLKKDRAYMALHWKGVALFYMGDFSTAKLAFEESTRLAPKSRAPRTLWRRKCDAELSGSTLPLGGLVAEVSRAPPQATASVASPAAAQEAADPRSDAAPPASTAPSVAAQDCVAASPAKAPEALSISGRKPVKREWYQNTSNVYITIFIKGVDEQACRVDFKERELSLAFPLAADSEEEYQLNLELFDAVDPTNCRLEVGKVKVELVLCKKTAGEQWKDLERRAEEVAVEPSYPTSSKQKRDWSQIDRDMDAELKAEKPEGDAALNTLFKQIYDRADEETRRAMNKSFQTSGGTVLSTNWGEVAKSDYEGKDRPTAPEGQEWADEVAARKT